MNLKQTGENEGSRITLVWPQRWAEGTEEPRVLIKHHSDWMLRIILCYRAYEGWYNSNE